MVEVESSGLANFGTEPIDVSVPESLLDLAKFTHRSS